MKILAFVLVFSGLAHASTPNYPFATYMDRYSHFQIKRILVEEEPSSRPTPAQALEAHTLELVVKEATSNYHSLVEAINKEGGFTVDSRRELILREATQLGALMTTPAENLSAEEKTRFLTHFYLLLIACDGTINKRLSTQVEDLLPDGTSLTEVQTRQTESSRMLHGLGLNALFLGGIAEFYAAFAYRAPTHLAGDLHLAGGVLTGFAFYQLAKLSREQVFNYLDKVNYALWQNSDLKGAIKKTASLSIGNQMSDAQEVRWFFGYFEDFFALQIRDAKVEITSNCGMTLENLNSPNSF